VNGEILYLISLVSLQHGSWWRNAAGAFWQLPTVFSTRPQKLIEWASGLKFDGVQALPMQGMTPDLDTQYILTYEDTWGIRTYKEVWSAGEWTIRKVIGDPKKWLISWLKWCLSILMDWMLFLHGKQRDEMLQAWKDKIPQIVHQLVDVNVEITGGIKDITSLTELVELAISAGYRFVADMRHLLELDGAYSLAKGEDGAHAILDALAPYLSRVIHLQPPVDELEKFFADPVNSPTGRIFVHALRIMLENQRSNEYGGLPILVVVEYWQGLTALISFSNKSVIAQAEQMLKAAKTLCAEAGRKQE